MEAIKSKSIDNQFLLFATVVLATFTANMLIGRGFDLSALSIDCSLVTLKGELLSDFVFIVIKRIKQLFVIALLLKCFNPELIIKLLFTITGVVFGLFITVQIYYYGPQGIIIFLLCLLPHYLVYIFLIKNLYDFNMYYKNEKLFVRFLTVIIILLGIGLVLEGFFSKFFLTKYYQYIVMHL
ncbi:MAG: hypothetical protein ACI4D8_00895 [Wujia sp.]